MYTVDTALESLRKYDISDSDIQRWERELGLDIPVDEYGRKEYSPHHINLFKNVKKHIALGRTVDEIRSIISLPPLVNSKPQQGRKTATQANATMQKSPYASVPRSPVTRQDNGAAQVVNLVQRLTKEKDQLYKKLLETEKLNSHLYSANNLFHKKVRDLTEQINELSSQTGDLQIKLRQANNEDEHLRLMSEKAQMQKQVIDSEKIQARKDQEIQNQRAVAQHMQNQAQQLEQRINQLSAPFDHSRFLGDWMESGKLVEVIYDNFGINIEPERVRLFRISEIPARIYNKTAVITTNYQYETNSLWKRSETLTVSYLDEKIMEGELISEYILDGVPVAKAIYKINCRRQ